MGRLYKSLKRIYEKVTKENSQEVYQTLIDKFVVLVTYEDMYLMNKTDTYSTIKMNGEDVLIDCGGYGILISPKDEVSIHT